MSASAAISSGPEMPQEGVACATWLTGISLRIAEYLSVCANSAARLVAAGSLGNRRMQEVEIFKQITVVAGEEPVSLVTR
jgi:hypothetical protein